MTKQNKYGKSLLWLVPLAAQFAFLTVLTFTRHVQFVDSDAAKLYAHAAAIWDAKTLFVPDWRYITTMELDCGLLFALPFYGLTHNILTAFACSNVVLYLLWTAVCFALARRLLPDAPQKAMAAGIVGSLLLLTPYTIDVLYYGNMLFLGGAQYVVKTMLPLLLIWLLTAPDTARPSRRGWAVLAVYLAGTLLTALSSGIYVAAMGLAPILLLYAVGWLREDERLTPYTAAATFGSVAATLVGLLWSRAMGIEIKGGKMVLAAADNLADNVRNCFVGIFRLMGAAAGESEVTEPAGVTQFLCYVVCAMLLLTAAGTILRLFRHKHDPQARREAYFAVPALWNLVWLSILDTRYGDAHFEVRYHLIWLVPLFVLFAVRAVCRIDAEPPRMCRTLKAALAVFVCLLALLCDRRGWKACTPDMEGASEIGRVQALCRYLSELDACDVYVVQASHAAEMGAVLDEKHTYKTLAFADAMCWLWTYDGPIASLDARPEHKPALLVLREDTAMADLPMYLQQAEFVAQVNVYTVYRLPDGSVADGVTGLPYRGGPGGVDYPDSVGYDHEGQPEADRSLTTDPAGGRVLKSPELTLSETADITVNWNPIEGQNATGRVVLYQGDEELAALPLTGTAVTLENLPAGSGYRLNVETEGGSIKINSIVFEPK